MKKLFSILLIALTFSVLHSQDLEINSVTGGVQFEVVSSGATYSYTNSASIYAYADANDKFKFYNKLGGQILGSFLYSTIQLNSVVYPSSEDLLAALQELDAFNPDGNCNTNIIVDCGTDCPEPGVVCEVDSIIMNDTVALTGGAVVFFKFYGCIDSSMIGEYVSMTTNDDILMISNITGTFDGNPTLIDTTIIPKQITSTTTFSVTKSIDYAFANGFPIQYGFISTLEDTVNSLGVYAKHIELSNQTGQSDFTIQVGPYLRLDSTGIRTRSKVVNNSRTGSEFASDSTRILVVDVETEDDEGTYAIGTMSLSEISSVIGGGDTAVWFGDASQIYPKTTPNILHLSGGNTTNVDADYVNVIGKQGVNITTANNSILLTSKGLTKLKAEDYIHLDANGTNGFVWAETEHFIGNVSHLKDPFSADKASFELSNSDNSSNYYGALLIDSGIAMFRDMVICPSPFPQAAGAASLVSGTSNTYRLNLGVYHSLFDINSVDTVLIPAWSSQGLPVEFTIGYSGNAGDSILVKLEDVGMSWSNAGVSGGEIWLRNQDEQITVYTNGFGGYFIKHWENRYIPIYANDTDADNDGFLGSGHVYRLSGNRTVFVKP